MSGRHLPAGAGALHPSESIAGQTRYRYGCAGKVPIFRAWGYPEKNQVHVKSDERILGDGDFVEKSRFKSQEAFERQYTLKAQGVDLDYVVDRVAQIFEMESEHLWMPGKSRQQVTSRSLLCFWAVRELGESMASLAKRLNISTAAVSKSVARGVEIADREGHELT